MLITKDFIYIHAYRTGGSFTQRFFEKWFCVKQVAPHAPIRSLKELNFTKLTHKKIGVYRDPWTWYLSTYRHHYADYNTNEIGEKLNFEDWVMACYSDKNGPPAFRNTYGKIMSNFFMLEPIHWPEYKELSSIDSNLFPMDYMIDFKNLHQSISDIMQSLNINISTRHLDAFKSQLKNIDPSSGQKTVSWNLEDYYSDELYNFVKEAETPFINLFKSRLHT